MDVLLVSFKKTYLDVNMVLLENLSCKQTAADQQSVCACDTSPIAGQREGSARINRHTHNLQRIYSTFQNTHKYRATAMAVCLKEATDLFNAT